IAIHFDAHRPSPLRSDTILDDRTNNVQLFNLGGSTLSRLDDRNALVTGGAQGLGRAIARRLAAEGARVTIVDLNEDKGRECIGLIQSAGGTAEFVKANVAKRDDIEGAPAAGAGGGWTSWSTRRSTSPCRKP